MNDLYEIQNSNIDLTSPVIIAAQISLESQTSLQSKSSEVTVTMDANHLMDLSEVDIDIKHKLIKIFDTALFDVHRNLSGSFRRFQSTELLDQETRAKEEIIDVMMKTTKV